MENIPSHICEYGCEKEAIFQLKNGKWCCSKYVAQCPSLKKKNSLANKGEKNHFFGKTHSEESKIKIGIKSIGRKSFLGRHHSEKAKNKMSNSRKGIYPTEEHKQKNRESNTGKKMPPRTKEWRKNQSNYMKSGGALKAIKAIKKISKEEIIIRDLVKELYPDCEFQYPVFRYSLDVAIPEHKIAIEYDGYYHFCSEEKIQYFKNRQKLIEDRGWKFLRYTIFDQFPTLEEMKNRIELLIKENKETKL